MLFRVKTARLDKSAGPFRRALEYAFYDWTREMKRIITYVGIALQGYALYFTLMWAFTGRSGYITIMVNIKSRVDPKFNEDDITMLVVKRLVVGKPEVIRSLSG